MKSAILLSGGIDSSALTALVKPDYAFVVNYGQICAKSEVRAASKVAKELSIPIKVIEANCGRLGSGELAGKGKIDIAPSPEWWPFRNQLLITLAAQVAVRMHIQSLLLGAVASDAFHADGTEEFFSVLDQLMALQEGNIRISVPAATMTSPELVRVSKISFEILGWTHSCHTNNLPCGLCRGCQKQLQVFKEIGIYE